MPFDGLRVLSLESRRAAEIERLIRSQGGVPFVAPSMREVPLEQNSLALDFAARVLGKSASGGDFDMERADFDMVIFLTGVGARLLNQIVETRYPAGSFIQALHGLTVVVRGSKPASVMREWGVPVAVNAPEPNTWRELLRATEGRPERRIAIQEFGRPATELVDGLRARGAEVTSVPVYQWDLPEDTGPLREAIHKLCAGEFDVILLTTSVQLMHLFKVAAEEGIEADVRQALARMVVASVGPSTSETLREYGIAPDMEPAHPKMGFLVSEAGSRARELFTIEAGGSMSDQHSPKDPGSGLQPKQNAGFLYAATKYTSVAMALPGATVGGYVIGYLLDKWLGTSYLKIVFLILGIISGFVELIRQLMRDMNTKK